MQGRALKNEAIEKVLQIEKEGGDFAKALPT